jgi:hypothetical protein
LAAYHCYTLDIRVLLFEGLSEFITDGTRPRKTPLISTWHYSPEK